MWKGRAEILEFPVAPLEPFPLYVGDRTVFWCEPFSIHNHQNPGWIKFHPCEPRELHFLDTSEELAHIQSFPPKYCQSSFCSSRPGSSEAAPSKQACQDAPGRGHRNSCSVGRKGTLLCGRCSSIRTGRFQDIHRVSEREWAGEFPGSGSEIWWRSYLR